MSGEHPVSVQRSDDGERSERASYWIALTIALIPIPAAVLISWALGAPPWAPRPVPSEVHEAPARRLSLPPHP